jgi:hypothetical protein
MNSNSAAAAKREDSRFQKEKERGESTNQLKQEETIKIKYKEAK